MAKREVRRSEKRIEKRRGVREEGTPQWVCES